MTTLTVSALALGAVDATDATVTLQVAPRGPGGISAVPTSPADTSPCTGHDAENDCEWTYERGTTVRLDAKVDAGAGKSFSGWSEPECGTSTSCTVKCRVESCRGRTASRPASSILTAARLPCQGAACCCRLPAP